MSALKLSVAMVAHICEIPIMMNCMGHELYINKTVKTEETKKKMTEDEMVG